jgi:hypothetical protein
MKWKERERCARAFSNATGKAAAWATTSGFGSSSCPLAHSRACYELALNPEELPTSKWTFAVPIGGFTRKVQKNRRF